MIANFGAKTVMTYRSSRKMEGWRGEVLKLAMASWIDANVGLKERIVVVDMGGLQYLYIRRSAVGFTFIPGKAPKYFSDEQWRNLGRQILKALPPDHRVDRGTMAASDAADTRVGAALLSEIIAFFCEWDSLLGSE